MIDLTPVFNVQPAMLPDTEVAHSPKRTLDGCLLPPDALAPKFQPCGAGGR